MGAAFGGQGQAGGGAHEQEAGVLVAGVVERVEAAADEGIVERTDGQQPGAEERRGEPPPTWIKPIILLSIPWAVSIHTVTAFLYSGLAARPFWMTAILAPRFLASAFAAGPALLILLALIVRKLTKFDPGKEAIQKLAEIVTYAMLLNVFFVAIKLLGAFKDIGSGMGEELMAQIGMNATDVITEINGVRLDKPQNGVAALRKLSTAKSITLKVKRNGTEVPLNIQLQ